MTAYVLTGDCNIRQLGTLSPSGSASARVGADTVDTNGFSFTIDQDCRYGLTGTYVTAFGSMTINAAKGGDINIDGRYVRLIPFTGGSGTITAGSTITCGSGTGVVIGIYSSMTTAPVLTGVAAGWIKVTAWNSIAFPTSGTFTQAGYTFTISGADTVGFIEVNGDETATINANRLGTFRVTGEWFSLGTTSGVSNQTLQIPTNGMLRHCPGVFIEKTAGQQDYEFYPNNGVNTTTGTEAARGKVVWITTAGLVRIGNSGAATNGYTPAAGLAVVVPNIIFENNTTANRAGNVLPSATITTRYDFTCPGGGVLEIDKACMNWYLSATQAYSCNVSDSCFTDGILLSEIAAPMTFSRVGVGNKPTTALLMSPLTMSLCFAGGTFTDCVWQRASMAASGAHTNTLTDLDGFTFVRDTVRAGVIRAHTTTYSIYATRVRNCTWINPTIIQGAMAFLTCNGNAVTDTVYCEAVSGTTVVTYAGYVWYVASSTTNCTFTGLTLPVANTHPYTSLFYSGTAGCSNIKVRNIGTRAAPLNMGTVNACGYMWTTITGAAMSNAKFQRIYVYNTRSGFSTHDNSSSFITEENVAGDYTDGGSQVYGLSCTFRGAGYQGTYSAIASCYGSHWRDVFNSLTSGRIVVMMNEPTTVTTSQVALAGGAAFTSAGTLYMPVIGQTATFEMPYYALGHTAFTATALVMAGGTATNYTYGFQIDKNDGAGWSALAEGYTATTLGTALAAVTGIDASKGFKLRLKITTSVTNTTAITSAYVVTVSTEAAQDYQYPLDVITTTLAPNVNITGAEIRVYDMDNSPAGSLGTEIAGTESSGSSFSFATGASNTVWIQIIQTGYKEFGYQYTTGSADATLPVLLTAETNS